MSTEPIQDITVVHSSDLHLGGGIDPADFTALEAVVAAAERLSVDLLSML
jgi:hypothetical protein